MKIGMMVDTYKPHVSGITNYIALNKKFMEAQGHEVYIFTFGNDTIIDDEHNIIRSPGMPLINTGYYFSLRYARAARELLQSMDVAHIHHPFLSGKLAMRYCRPHNIPIVFTNHTRYDLYTHAYLPILPEGVGISAMKAYLPSFCRSCNLVIAPSNGIADVLRQLGVDSPIEVVPNGVDLIPFQRINKSIDRSRFGIRPDAVLFIYVGRLGPEKNLPFLINAFGGICEASDHVFLMFVGDGPEKDNLQSLVQDVGLSDHVVFTGMVPYQQVPGYLHMADIFATASVTEGHPLSIIEAMAAGLPVLGINSPGVGDTIEDGVTGFLSSESLAAFTAKMMLMVTEKEKRIEMGQRARYKSNDYSIHRTIQLMMQHYTRLCTSTPLSQYSSDSMVDQ